MMSPILRSETPRHKISAGRERYLAHTDHLMMVVVDFQDGPWEHPDPLHNHPHEQITYVAEGRIRFFLDNDAHELSVGDMMTIPPDVLHAIQLLTSTARLVDSFSPIREDFLDTYGS
jgi:quercetin dioxygenase-like cupin family protein